MLSSFSETQAAIAQATLAILAVVTLRLAYRTILQPGMSMLHACLHRVELSHCYSVGP